MGDLRWQVGPLYRISVAYLRHHNRMMVRAFKGDLDVHVAGEQSWVAVQLIRRRCGGAASGAQNNPAGKSRNRQFCAVAIN